MKESIPLEAPKQAGAAWGRQLQSLEGAVGWDLRLPGAAVSVMSGRRDPLGLRPQRHQPCPSCSRASEGA